MKRWATTGEDQYGEGYGSSEPEVHLNFRAHKRHFKLRLKRDTGVFSPTLQIDGDAVNRENELDTSHLYTGHLDGKFKISGLSFNGIWDLKTIIWEILRLSSAIGISDSHVFGSIRDGVFDGKIITPKETYYVERSNKYPLSSTNASLHSVIYSENDVHDPYHHNRTGISIY